MMVVVVLVCKVIDCRNDVRFNSESETEGSEMIVRKHEGKHKKQSIFVLAK